MRKSVKEKWLKALRSGEYKQTQHFLKDEMGFCCLGVLCDTHRKTIKKKGCTFTPKNDKEFKYDKTSGVPSDKVLKWAGIKTSSGVFTYKNGNSENLANLNDNGKSFKQIANIIEKYF